MTNLDLRPRLYLSVLFLSRPLLALALVALAVPSNTSAQSRLPLSLQGSVLSTLVTADGTSAPGIGGEVQARVNTLAMRRGKRGLGVLSVGGGGQYTAHVFSDGTLTVAGAFLEPRVAWQTPREGSFRYVALRAASLRQTSPAATSSRGYAVGAGGGLGRTLGFRHNFDVGAAVLYQEFGDALTPSGRSFRFRGALSFALKMGVTVSFGGA